MWARFCSWIRLRILTHFVTQPRTSWTNNYIHTKSGLDSRRLGMRSGRVGLDVDAASSWSLAAKWTRKRMRLISIHYEKSSHCRCERTNVQQKNEDTDQRTGPRNELVIVQSAGVNRLNKCKYLYDNNFRNCSMTFIDIQTKKEKSPSVIYRNIFPSGWKTFFR